MRRLEVLEELLSGSCSVRQLCSELSNIFQVRLTEVGLVRLEGQSLRFLFPTELQYVGTIPLSSSAVAARTAVSKLPERYNQFATVLHHNIFEKIRLEGTPEGEAPAPIQKLMSAPILDEANETLGVIQISRKGPSRAAAGPDFTSEDLETLECAARRIGYMSPEVLRVAAKLYRPKLRFTNTVLLKKKA